MKKTLLLSACAVTLFSTQSIAAEQDKSGYTLFNPTPKELMREMSTDRPDKTESPYTVDAGHFQFETDLVNYTRNRDTNDGANTRTSAFDVMAINAKAGLLNNLDIQFVVESYKYDKTTDYDAGTTEKKNGFGDITTRLKYNVWGNDGGTTALAIMPFVKWPTNSDDLANDDVEYGVIVPLAVDLGNDWGMGLMTELDINKDEDDTGYHAEYVNSITFSKGITEELGMYAEFFTSKSSEEGADWANTLDFGMTYGIGDNIQLDAGVNIGVTDAADDFNPFMGATYRF